MALRLQRRSAFGWPATPAPSADTDHGMAVHYEGGVTGIASWEHARCVEHWNRTRRFHMNTRGWMDIGYAWGCCPHFVLEGRGGFRAQAAQPGGNTTWESATFMTGPGEKPHPGQVENFRALRAWRMSKGVARAIRPHSSFSATSCPGDLLRRMIADGTLFRAPSEDDMPLTDAEIERIAARSAELASRQTLERLANKDGSLAVKARQQIAAEVWFRVRKDLHLDGEVAEANLNGFTTLFRAVQHAHGAHEHAADAHHVGMDIFALLQERLPIPAAPTPTPEPPM